MHIQVKGNLLSVPGELSQLHFGPAKRVGLGPKQTEPRSDFCLCQRAFRDSDQTQEVTVNQTRDEEETEEGNGPRVEKYTRVPDYVKGYVALFSFFISTGGPSPIVVTIVNTV